MPSPKFSVNFEGRNCTLLLILVPGIYVSYASYVPGSY